MSPRFERIHEQKLAQNDFLRFAVQVFHMLNQKISPVQRLVIVPEIPHRQQFIVLSIASSSSQLGLLIASGVALRCTKNLWQARVFSRW